MSKPYLSGLVMALLALASPASAGSTYSPPDAAPRMSPDARDASSGFGSVDNLDASALLNSRLPTARSARAGFLPCVSGQFSVMENTLQNTTFASPWAGASQGGPAVPTVVANNAIAPDGTMTAATLTVPPVTVASSSSLFSEVFNGVLATIPLTSVIYVNNPAGNSPVWVVINGFFASANHYQRQIVPGDGAWHKVVVPIPGFGTSSNLGFSVGVDLRDGSETASPGTKNVLIWHPSLFVGAHTDIFNFIPTTTAAITLTQVIQCPLMPDGSRMAFRDYSRLTPYAAPPAQSNGLFPPTGAILNWNSGSSYQSGGTSEPVGTITVNGVTYGWASSGSAGNADFAFMSLWQSTSPGQWTEVNPGTPTFTSNGSNMGTFILHGQFAKCSTAPFCVFFSATPVGGGPTSNVFLSTASSVTGPYSTPTIVVADNTPNQSTAAAHPALPSILDVAGTQYMAVAQTTNGTNQLILNYLTSPDTDGINWTMQGTLLPAPLAGDGDFPRSLGTQDPDLIQNACGPNGKGWYELYYTANETVAGSQYQDIYVGISPWPTGPFFKSPAPMFPRPTPLSLASWYLATQGVTRAYLGFTNVRIVNGTFWYTATANTNSATLPEGIGVAATMPDLCAVH